MLGARIMTSSVVQQPTNVSASTQSVIIGMIAGITAMKLVLTVVSLRGWLDRPKSIVISFPTFIYFLKLIIKLSLR